MELIKMPKWLMIVSMTMAITVWGYTIYLIINDKRKKTAFYKREITSTVIKSRNFHSRSIEFHLKDGAMVYYYPPIDGKIAIGDSIFKPRNTFIYKLYRKESDNKYQLIGVYDYQKSK